MPSITLSEIKRRIDSPVPKKLKDRWRDPNRAIRLRSEGIGLTFSSQRNNPLLTQNGYLPQRELGNALTHVTPGAQEIHRFVHPTSANHFMTTNPAGEKLDGWQKDESTTIVSGSSPKLYAFPSQTMPSVKGSYWVPLYQYRCIYFTKIKKGSMLQRRSTLLYSQSVRKDIENSFKQLDYITRISKVAPVELSFGVRRAATKDCVPLYLSDDPESPLALTAKPGTQCQILGYVATTKLPNTIPLYQWHNKKTGEIVYKTSDSDIFNDTMKKEGYSTKKVFCYVMPKHKIPLLPVFRWYHPLHGHFYTNEVGVEPSGGYGYEGIAFYLLQDDTGYSDTTKLCVFSGPYKHPLHQAAALNLSPEINDLLKKNPDLLNQRDSQKRTAIDVAYEFGSMSAMQNLKAKGAMLTERDINIDSRAPKVSTDYTRVAEGIFFTKGLNEKNYSYTSILDFRELNNPKVIHVGVHDKSDQSSFDHLMTFLGSRNPHGVSNVSSYIFSADKVKLLLRQNSSHAANNQPTLAHSMSAFGLNLGASLLDNIENKFFKSFTKTAANFIKVRQTARCGLVSLVTADKTDTPFGLYVDNAIMSAALKHPLAAAVYVVGFTMHTYKDDVVNATNLSIQYANVLDKFVESQSLGFFPLGNISGLAGISNIYRNTAYMAGLVVDLFKFKNSVVSAGDQFFQDNNLFLGTPLGKLAKTFYGSLDKESAFEVSFERSPAFNQAIKDLLSPDAIDRFVNAHMKSIHETDEFNPTFTMGDFTMSSGEKVRGTERLSNMIDRVILRDGMMRCGLDSIKGQFVQASSSTDLSQFHALFHMSPARQLLQMSENARQQQMAAMDSHGSFATTSSGGRVATSSGASVHVGGGSDRSFGRGKGGGR